jgi:putative flavoprotein involved in K+ transport
MTPIPAVIVGAGQAGLATSHCLARHGVEHVVLERGDVGTRWTTARWRSLRLLTPNWMSRLPGWGYQGPDPDGFMSAGALQAWLHAYAASLSASIHTHTCVEDVRATADGYAVTTDRGSWRARVVIVATGDCVVTAVPHLAAGLSPSIQQVHPTGYRGPEQLPDGGVLVVGASATGAQLAAEIHASDRPVTLSVGRHTRLPRRYRGQDILWWMDRAGVLSEPLTTAAARARFRGQPSMQLTGRTDMPAIDLASLHDAGVRIVSRTRAIEQTRVALAQDLSATLADAQDRLDRLLDRIDGIADGAPPADRDARRTIRLPEGPGQLDLATEGIRSVVWATGYRRHDPWLAVPVRDASGAIRHDRGITAAPGLYVVGERGLSARNSSFIDGVGADAARIAAHAARTLNAAAKAAA